MRAYTDSRFAYLFFFKIYAAIFTVYHLRFLINESHFATRQLSHLRSLKVDLQHRSIDTSFLTQVSQNNLTHEMQWNLYNGIEIFCNNYLLHQVSVLQLILCT